MDFENGRNERRNRTGGSCLRSLFQSFVCVALTVLLGIHVYAYIWGPMEISDGFGEVKYVVMQLMRGLSEVNRKHDHLKGEMERISAVLPALAASADRAKDAIEPSLRKSLYDLRDYDRQMTDYALESAGAKIVDTGGTIDYIIYESPINYALHTLTYMLCRECQGARAIINPGSLPGECWAFRGSKGEATIRLPGPVHITAISLEHISPQISPTKEISSAPRLFQVEGLEYRQDPYAHDFGSFEYDKEAKPIQYFEVLHLSAKSFNFVRIRIITNWGNPVFTCVYRVRLHGELDTGQSTAKYDDELKIENEEWTHFLVCAFYFYGVISYLGLSTYVYHIT